MQPLLKNIKSLPVSEPELVVSKVGFVNFNENEESTCIETINFLRFSWFKSYFLVPIFSILSVFYLPVYIYWRVSARAAWLYSEVEKLEQATHVLIHGRDGNIEICNLENLTT